MKINFILIILLLFIFINKVQAENKIVKFADFSKNEILFSKENYLIVGNIENDFNSIKYFSDKYCSNLFGDNYMARLIQISSNVSFVNCVMIDELKQFNLTPIERSCFHRFELNLNTLYNRECINIDRDFKPVLTTIEKYREKINYLNSDAFVYEILNEDLSKKISNFETKTLLPLDAIIINRNINLCDSYGFVEGSELYFKCILILIKNHNQGQDLHLYNYYPR